MILILIWTYHRYDTKHCVHYYNLPHTHSHQTKWYIDLCMKHIRPMILTTSILILYLMLKLALSLIRSSGHFSNIHNIGSWLLSRTRRALSRNISINDYHIVKVNRYWRYYRLSFGRKKLDLMHIQSNSIWQAGSKLYKGWRPFYNIHIYIYLHIPKYH